MLFIGSCNSLFRAIDTRTGTPLWDYDIMKDGMQKSFHGKMFFRGDLVFIGTDIPSGSVYAFDTAEGTVRWRHFAGLGVHGDIVGADSVLYALTKEDTLLCLACRDGHLLWSFHPGMKSEGDNDSSPCHAGERVFFRDGGRSLYALSASTGEHLWTRELPGDPTTSPFVLNDGVYVGTSDGTLLRLTTSAGEIEAVLTLGGAPYGVIAHAGGGLVLLTGRRGRGDALVSVESDLDGVRWRRKPPPETEWTTYRPDIWDNAVLVGDGTGKVTSLRARDGRVEWSYDVGGTIKTVSHHGDTLLVGTFEGALHAYSASALHRSEGPD